jgi:putative peptidoglycan lipid II flippase
VADRVAGALGRVSYFLIPSALVYVALGDVVVAALFQTGAFGTPETLVTWAVLTGYALGLPASAASRVLSSAFYALRDARTPARIAYARVAVSTLVGVTLMFPLDRLGFESLRLGASGLALGASVGAWVEFVLLRRALGKRVGAHGPGMARILRYVLAAALAVGVGVLLQNIGGGLHPIVAAGVVLPAAGLAYIGGVRLLEALAPASAEGG